MPATRMPDRADVARPRPPRPVFLDRSGRRRRLLKFVGLIGGCTLVAALALLILAVSGASPVSIPGLPDARRSATAPPDPAARPSVDPSGGDGSGPTAAGGSAAGQTVATTGGATASAKPGSTRRNVPSQTPPHPTKSR